MPRTRKEPLPEAPSRESEKIASDRSFDPRAFADQGIALQITKEILTARQESGIAFDKEAIYEEVVLALTGVQNEQIAEIAAENEARFRYLIGGGRSAFETELGYIENDPSISAGEKRIQKDRLARDYTDAKIAEKMAMVKIIEFLLDKFLNPYQSLAELSALTESGQNEAGQWSSDFIPESAGSELKGCVSKKSLEEIRAGIQLALQMRSQVNELLTAHRGYDGRPDGREIIEKVYGKKIAGRARVVAEGPLCISIAIDDEKDYYALLGNYDPEKRSGGFHGNYLYRASAGRSFGNQFTTTGNYGQTGLINLINGYPDQGTIDHENEHSFYEIHMWNRGQKPDALPVLKEKIRRTPKSEHGKFIDGAFDEMLFEADGRFIAGFANEAMAYVLNNESPTTPTETIIDSNFRRLTENKLYAHHHISQTVLETIKKDMLSPLSGVTKDSEIDEAVAAAIEIYEKKVEERITKKQLEENFKSILRALADLVKRFPKNKNFIRALLAGENPLKWEKIARAVLGNMWRPDSDKETRSFEIRKGKERQLKKQLGTAWALIETWEELPEEKSESGEESEVVYSLDISREVYVNNHFNQFLFELKRPLFEVKDSSGRRRLIDGETGKNVFGCHFNTLFKPIDAGGLCAARVEIRRKNEKESLDNMKSLIAKEGSPELLGFEYADVGDPVYFGGRLVFPAEHDNGLWVVVDEKGQQIGSKSQFDSIGKMEVVGEHLYIFGRIEGKQLILDEEGKIIVFAQKAGNLSLLKNGAKSYFVEDGPSDLYRKIKNFYDMNGNKIELPDKPDEEREWQYCVGRDGLIFFIQSSYRKKESQIFFQNSGKRYIGFGSISKVNDDTSWPLFMITIDGKDHYVNDIGEDVTDKVPSDVQESFQGRDGQSVYWTQDCFANKDKIYIQRVWNQNGEKIAEGKSISKIPSSVGGGNVGQVSAFFLLEDETDKKFVLNSEGKKLFEITSGKKDFRLMHHYYINGRNYIEDHGRESCPVYMDEDGRTIAEGYLIGFKNGHVIVQMENGDIVKKPL